MIQRDHPSCRLLADSLEVPKLMSFASFQGSKVTLEQEFQGCRDLTTISQLQQRANK